MNMKKVFNRKNSSITSLPVFAALSAGMMLGACGNIKTLETERKEFKDLSKDTVSVLSEEDANLVQAGISAEIFFLSQGVQNQGSSLSVGAAQSVVQENGTAFSACSFVEELGQEVASNKEEFKNNGTTFRFLNELKIVEKDGESVAVGSYNLGKNPQIHFFLSREKGESGVGAIEAKIPDMPSFRQLMKADIKAKLDAMLAGGQIDEATHTALLAQKIKEEVDDKTDGQLIPLRNGAAMKGLADLVPGVIILPGQETVLSGPVAKSLPMAEFYKASKLVYAPAKLNELRVTEMQPLTTEMPMFSKKVSLADDWRRVLRIAVARSQQSGMPVTASEEACFFALTQRLSAQIAVQKGYVDAPVLTEEGLLDPAAFLTSAKGGYEHKSVSGYFAEIVSSQFIKKQMDGFAALAEGKLELEDGTSINPEVVVGSSIPLNGRKTKDFVDTLQAWSQLMAARKVPAIWAVTPAPVEEQAGEQASEEATEQASEPFDPSKNKILLPASISQLATGIFSILAPVTQVEKGPAYLKVDPKTNALSFPGDDSSVNILRAFETALLHRLTLATVISDYSDVDNEVLGGLSAECAKDPKIIVLKKDEVPTPHPCLNTADQTALQTRAKLGADVEGTALHTFTRLSDGSVLEVLRRMQDGRMAPGSEEYAAGIRVLELAAYVIKSPGILNRAASLRSAQ